MEETLNRLGKLINERSLRWPVGIATTITGVAFTVGLVTTVQALALWAGIALILTLGASLILVTLSRHALFAEVETYQSVLEWYSGKIYDRQKNTPGLFSIEEWFEQITVEKKTGHATIMRRLTLRIGPNPVDAFWNVSFPTHVGTLSEKRRAKVRAFANTIEEGGHLGTSLNLTKAWVDGHKLRVIVHLGKDLEPGEEFTVEFSWEWPGFYKAFLDGRAETHDWMLRHETKKFSAELALPRGMAPNGVRTSPLEKGGRRPVQKTQRNGSITLTHSAKNVPANTKIGYVVELIR